jgi:anti-sigma B factor antagonist
MVPPNSKTMTVRTVNDWTEVRFSVKKLDDDNYKEVGEQLYDLVAKDRNARLRLDFAGVEFVTSAFLAKLLGLHRRLTEGDGGLALCNLTPAVHDVFETTGLTFFLHVIRTGESPMLPPAHKSMNVRTVNDLTEVSFNVKKLNDDNFKEIGDHLYDLAATLRPARMRLDFANVEFVTSTALGKLLGLHRRLKETDGKLTLCNLTPMVYEVFETTGLTFFLDVQKAAHA